MRCPLCGQNNDRVLESRSNSSGTSIRRRRECLACGYRFTSYEQIVEKQLMVIKRDGRREAFDPMKLERGIQTSMEKRPVSQKVIEEMVREIEDEISLKQGEHREIETSRIGELVLTKLYEVDKVAYIRFASVYKMFENIESFKNELDQLFQKNGYGEEKHES